MIRIIVLEILLAIIFGIIVGYFASDQLVEDDNVAIISGIISTLSVIIVEIYAYYSFKGRGLDIFKANGIWFYFFIFSCVLTLLILILLMAFDEIKYFLLLLIIAMVISWLFSPNIMNIIERNEIKKEIESKEYNEIPLKVTLKIGETEKTYYLYETPQTNENINE